MKGANNFRKFHGGIKDEDILDFSISVNPFVPGFILQVLNKKLQNLRRYTYTEWVEELFRKYFGNNSVIVGGATEAFHILGWTLMEDAHVIIPTPNYTEYGRVATFKAKEIIKVNYVEAKEIELDILKNVLETTATKLKKHKKIIVITGNPNNPTGICKDYSILLDWSLNRYETDVIFIIDEVFIDFVPEKMRIELDEKIYPNLILVRSFTKILGLPGVRVGYVKSSQFKELFEKYRMPWAIGGDGYTLLEAIVENKQNYEYFVRQTQQYFAEQRERFSEFIYYPSLTNYIVVKVGDVKKFIAKLNKEHMHAREMFDFGINDSVRIGLKKPEDNEKMLDFLILWTKEMKG